MGDHYISLREYIRLGKANSFLNLMKLVDDEISKLHNNGLLVVDINLDQIMIDFETGKTLVPAHNISDPLEKTIASYGTGISLMEDHKTSREHNELSFALMILGWYVNSDKSAIKSDVEVLENYSEYMTKCPRWILPFFDEKFRRMNNSLIFADYYNKEFIDKINNDLRSSLNFDISYNEFERISKKLVHSINNQIHAELNNGQINKEAVFDFYEQYVLDKFQAFINSYGIVQNNDTTSTQNEKVMKLVRTNGTSMYNDEYADPFENDLYYDGKKYVSNRKESAFTNVVTLVSIIIIILFICFGCFLIFPYLF